MKLANLSFLGVLLLSSVAMADVRLDLNGGERSLGQCGGTIEATVGGTSDQVHLTVRNVQKCSNFVMRETGKEYKIDGADGNRNGSFSIAAGKLRTGWNKVKLTVRSNSGKTRDDVAIWIQVAR